MHNKGKTFKFSIGLHDAAEFCRYLGDQEENAKAGKAVANRGKAKWFYNVIHYSVIVAVIST